MVVWGGELLELEKLGSYKELGLVITPWEEILKTTIGQSENSWE